MAYPPGDISICTGQSFKTPVVFGAEIVSMTSSVVSNFSATVPEQINYNHPTISVDNVTFCNITVTLTHPGFNDKVITEAWLPIGTWNGRLQGRGGSGFTAGREVISTYGMQGAIGQGYATMATDAGLGSDAYDPSSWALTSTGNVNLIALDNLNARSLYDEAIIVKSLIQDFYGRAPEKSYWSGCSQGGRQGLILAQRYPTLYDGIVASAPSNHWNQVLSSIYWPQLFMNLAGEYPHGCEVDEITNIAVAECDPLDGVTDGLISDIDSCNFDPFSTVGRSFYCYDTGSIRQISDLAARVANASWSGMASSTGKKLWYGVNRGTILSGNGTGTSATDCSTGTCVGSPSQLAVYWIQQFLAKDRSVDISKLTHEQFDRLFESGYHLYESLLAASDPDLSAFHNAGGKLLAFHGLADALIPSGGSRDYYNAVTALDNKVSDFYRLFEVPGLGHCSGGTGGQPTAIFDAMRAWVENGTAPDTLPIQFIGGDGETNNRILCPYPAKARYRGTGPTTSADSYHCSM
ncbi:unnamed protein product [Clonostachys chloroleuca]|uniref:Carboxylic ester hydrolase n=1 Tax=Clonostachys chloroleuca TaxID=1926264 RepID=A0AA35LS67_9HYPO|nr:unnamed protein product [Clonostachys chloroleuca]